MHKPLSVPHHQAAGSKAILLAAILAACVGGFHPGTARADDPYALSLTVDGQTYYRSYANIEAAMQAVRERNIRAIAPNYTAGSQVTANVSIRGVPATITRDAGGNTLVLSVPSAGVQQVFEGATAAEASRRLEDFARGRTQSDDLRKIYDAIVATSTVDPVAGNPSSLQGQSVMADYAAGTAVPGDLGRMEPREAGWHFALGGAFTSQQTRDFDTNAYDLPLGVSYTFGTDGPELFLNVPLALTETSGANSYIGSGGVGLRIPVITTPDLRWALTPALRGGAAGSSEVGSVGSIFGGSVTSDLRIALPADLVLGIGNGIGYYETKPVKVGNYDLRYDLQNTYYRNGVSISRPVGEVSGLPILIGASFVDTRLAGDDLAVRSWQEYGVSATLGTAAPVRFAMTYMDGRNGFNALRFGLSLAF